MSNCLRNMCALPRLQWALLSADLSPNSLAMRRRYRIKRVHVTLILKNELSIITILAKLLNKNQRALWVLRHLPFHVQLLRFQSLLADSKCFQGSRRYDPGPLDRLAPSPGAGLLFVHNNKKMLTYNWKLWQKHMAVVLGFLGDSVMTDWDLTKRHFSFCFSSRQQETDQSAPATGQPDEDLLRLGFNANRSLSATLKKKTLDGPSYDLHLDSTTTQQLK